MSDKIRSLPDNLLEHIREQIESVDYGSVIIRLQGANSIIDVSTEKRERFDIK